jgi:hypothetical protein
VLEVREPEKRRAGAKVASATDLVAQLRAASVI